MPLQGVGYGCDTQVWVTKSVNASDTLFLSPSNSPALTSSPSQSVLEQLMDPVPSHPIIYILHCFCAIQYGLSNLSKETTTNNELSGSLQHYNIISGQELCFFGCKVNAFPSGFIATYQFHWKPRGFSDPERKPKEASYLLFWYFWTPAAHLYPIATLYRLSIHSCYYMCFSVSLKISPATKQRSSQWHRNW